MNYKPEIDGLRAVAVLLVLLCHMQLGAAGGYIGVDVFFVISGYLITTILLGSIPSGKFGFWNFYGRRFVRLYPALLVTVALTFLAGFLLSDPLMLENLARTGKYALGSVSNLFYNKHQGYFDVAAQKQIFLHTWSLGVEWQFYLIWPALIWLIYKLPIKKQLLDGTPNRTQLHLVLALLIIITVTSVIASQWAVTHDKATSAYYQMPYRAFELGIGALLVFCYNIKIKPATGVGLVVVGMAAILYAAFAFSPTSIFPGVNALIPCLGAAACMLGGKAFSRGNLLRLKPIVFFGQASYSIYLLHWPLLVFYSYYVYRPLALIEKLSLVAVSVLLGMLMYLWVEKRINWRRFASVKGGTLMGCAAMFAIIIATVPFFDYVNKKGEGLHWRLKSVQLDSMDFFRPAYLGYKDFSVLGDEESKPIAVIAGDSFAHSYATGFDEYLAPLGKSINLYTNPGCVLSPTYTRTDFNQKQTAGCTAVYEDALMESKTHAIPFIWVQSWENYRIHDFRDKETQDVVEFSSSESYDAFTLKNLNELYERMEGRPLILVATVPYYKIDMNEKECLARPEYVPNKVCHQQFPVSYPIEEAVVQHINAELKLFAESHDNVYYINPEALACPNGVCTSIHNAMIYNDGSHLSKFGSRLLSPYVLGEVNKIINSLHPPSTL